MNASFLCSSVMELVFDVAGVVDGDGDGGFDMITMCSVLAR